MARLIFGTPTGEQAIDLRPANGLGRHPSNSIQLMDKIASKEHCVIEQRGAQYVLRDLGSLNGTYVNGRRVTGEMLLRHGDEIELGMTRARFALVTASARKVPCCAGRKAVGMVGKPTCTWLPISASTMSGAPL